MPRIREAPEDFRVSEIPQWELTGDGPHTYLWIEKRLTTTEGVARQLAAVAGVANRDVGFAGRKDRRAVARQWFSVPDLEPQRGLALELEGAEVLEAKRHRHKLRAGQLRGNRFEIVVRELEEAASEEALDRLSDLERHGFANRFGRQRFGRDGRNAERGASIARGENRLRDRRMAKFLVSALQSAIFNEVLRQRRLPIDALRRGDVGYLHATGGTFLVREPEKERQRLERFELSPSGPIFGEKMRQAEGETRDEELRALATFSLVVDDGSRPGVPGLPGGRRPLRARPHEARGERRGTGGLYLEFTLPPGTYATVLLEELFAGRSLVEGPVSAATPQGTPSDGDAGG